MPTIAEIATTSDDFNILANAIGFVDAEIPDADVAGTLAATDADLSVFAPTDAAFTQLATDLGFVGDTADEAAVTGFLATTLGAQTILDVLLYHVSPGARTLGELNSLGTVPTANGATLEANGLILIDNEPDLIDPSVVVPNVVASNGIIQGIDRVLLPADLPGNDAPTITALVAESGGEFDSNGGDFDILLNAVITAGLADTLDDPNADLTVFAPTDDAFIGLAHILGFAGSDEAGAFDYIVDALTLLGGGDPIPLLTEVLTYHVVGESLQSLEVLRASSIETLQGGDLTPMGTTPPSLGDLDPNLPDPALIALDIQAENGIVHVIDGVLAPLAVSEILAPPTDLAIGGDGGDLIVTGNGVDFIDGNRGADTIFAGKGADFILGGRGKDTIFAGRGKDVIDAGGGDDRISLKGGSETLIFQDGDDVDLVFNFRLNDVIDVSDFGVSDFADIAPRIADLGASTAVVFGGGDTLVLAGFDAGDLTADNFIF